MRSRALILLFSFISLVSCDSKVTEDAMKEEVAVDVTKLSLAEQLGHYLLYDSTELSEEDYQRISDSINAHQFDMLFTVFGTNDSLQSLAYIMDGIEEMIDGCYWMRNIYHIEHLDSNKMYHRNHLVENLKTQKDSMKSFIISDPNSEYMPEFKMKKIQFFGEQPVSKQSFHIYCRLNDSTTTFDRWRKLQELTYFIKGVYDEIQDEFSREFFGKPYHDLDFERKIAVNELHPVRIFLHPNQIEKLEPPPVLESTWNQIKQDSIPTDSIPL